MSVLIRHSSSPGLRATLKPWQVFGVSIYKSKGKDPQNIEVKKATRRWERFLAFVGDGYLVEDTQIALLDGLDEYVLQRRTDGVSEATIHRELADVVACINHGAEKRRLTWKLSRPKQRPHDPALRSVLTWTSRSRLVKYCLNSRSKARAIRCISLLGSFRRCDSDRESVDYHQRISTYRQVPLRCIS